MQKQFTNSECSNDKYSISSKTGRRLYQRINNNIRVLNKSKLSNKSNNSIGSVALRRTELSNDKIYSRQEQFIPFDSSQVGVDFQTICDTPSSKKSIPMTPLQSNDNYEQRIKKSLSQRSLRSDSQRSDRYRTNKGKKLNNEEIYKYFMLGGQKDTPTLINDNKSNRSYKKSDCNQMKSSRQKRQHQNNLSPYPSNEKNPSYNQIRSIRSIKSSLKSQLKSSLSKKLKQRNNYAQSNGQSNNYDLKRLSQKYNQINSIRSKTKKISAQNENQQDKMTPRKQKQRKYHKDTYREQQRYNKYGQPYNESGMNNNTKIHNKYQSQKYLPDNGSEFEMYSKYIKQAKHKQKTNAQGSINEEYERYYIEGNRNQSKNQIKNQYENQYKRHMIDKKSERVIPSQQSNKMYRKNVNYYQQSPKNFNDYYLENNKNRSNQKKQKTVYGSNSKKDQSSILNLLSNNQPPQQRKSIKIKENQYSNIYKLDREYQREDEEKYRKYRVDQNRKYNNDAKYREQEKSRRKNQTNRAPEHNHGKYKNTSPTTDYNHLQKEKRTQISQNFDSFMLSINSRVTGMNSQASIQNIIQKVKLHLKTLSLIADYTHEFRKMYEEIQQWEELIFLSYKKFWVERTKVFNYIKKYKIQRKHQSERMRSANKRNVLGHKLSLKQNMGSQNNKKDNDNIFDDIQNSQNPFIIPFCKLTQDEIKQLINTEEGHILLQQIEKQNQETYKGLQEMYNFIIQKSGNHVNMLFCDNFCDDIYILMLDEIDQLIPNLQQFSVFEVTKIRLGKIVKAGILILFLNGKYIRNISQILTFDDLQKTGNKKKIKPITTYDLFYEVFEKIVSE